MGILDDFHNSEIVGGLSAPPSEQAHTFLICPPDNAVCRKVEGGTQGRAAFDLLLTSGEEVVEEEVRVEGA